jgi:hypothetical protein
MTRTTARNETLCWGLPTALLLAGAGACGGAAADVREVPAYSAVRVEGTLGVHFSPDSTLPLVVRCGAAPDPTANLLDDVPDATDLVHTSVEDGVLTLRAMFAATDGQPRRVRGVTVPAPPRCSVELGGEQVLDFIHVKGNGDVLGGTAAEFIVDGRGDVSGAMLRTRPNGTIRVNHHGSGTLEFQAPRTLAALHIVNRGGGTIRVEPDPSSFVESLVVEQHGAGNVEAMVAVVLGGARVHATGSGTVWLQGRAPSVEVHLEGTGKVNAGSLATRRAEVWAEGSGLVRVMTTGTSQVFTRGPVQVEVLGSPVDSQRQALGPLGTRLPDATR